MTPFIFFRQIDHCGSSAVLIFPCMFPSFSNSFLSMFANIFFSLTLNCVYCKDNIQNMYQEKRACVPQTAQWISVTSLFSSFFFFSFSKDYGHTMYY